jgi:hypothetical protein
MKKQLLLLVAMFVGITSFSQTAPDFTATDCNGNTHHLYAELNAGKVIVLNWVMPCSSCISASLTAYNIVQSMGSSNVVYYLIDDAANTSCTSLSSWANSSGIGLNRSTFSTASIVESNYGGVGMPHIAVVGTSNHTFYFNALNTAANNATGIQNAINAALAATGINEPLSTPYQLNVVNSNSTKSVKVSYSLKETNDIKLEIVNYAGQVINQKVLGKQTAGDYSTEFDSGAFAGGIYFVRFTAGIRSETVRFVVVK